jgi:hypothetical protein
MATCALVSVAITTAMPWRLVPRTYRQHAAQCACAPAVDVSSSAMLMQGKRGPLETWDESFYKAKLQMAKFNLSDEDIRPYFALPTVLDGMHSVRVPHIPRAVVAPAARRAAAQQQSRIRGCSCASAMRHCLAAVRCWTA